MRAGNSRQIPTKPIRPPRIGRQAGIVTDNTHNKAKIVSVDSKRILEALDDGLPGQSGLPKTN